jgi:hypothetical protein
MAKQSLSNCDTLKFLNAAEHMLWNRLAIICPCFLTFLRRLGNRLATAQLLLSHYYLSFLLFQFLRSYNRLATAQPLLSDRLATA